MLGVPLALDVGAACDTRFVAAVVDPIERRDDLAECVEVPVAQRDHQACVPMTGVVAAPTVERIAFYIGACERVVKAPQQLGALEQELTSSLGTIDREREHGNTRMQSPHRYAPVSGDASHCEQTRASVCATPSLR